MDGPNYPLVPPAEASISSCRTASPTNSQPVFTTLAGVVRRLGRRERDG